MAAPRDKLPRQLREHLKNIDDARHAREIVHVSLQIIYDTTFHLAGIALSDYRAQTPPQLKVERQLARLGRTGLDAYLDLFRRATSATDGALCSLRDIGTMRFREVSRLQALMDAADQTRKADGTVLHHLYADARKDAPRSLNVHDFFAVVVRMRNLGHGHLEESGWDAVEDFFKEAAAVMRATAFEFLDHPVVAKITDRWYVGAVAGDPTAGAPLRVRFGENVEAIEVAHDPRALPQLDGWRPVRNAEVLVRETSGQPELRGPHLSLFDRPLPAPRADEALTAAIEASSYRSYFAAATAIRTEFAPRPKSAAPGRPIRNAPESPAPEEVVDPQVIDDLIVMVLEDFKLTVAPLESDALIARLEPLLDRHSPALPPRVIRDVAYFTSLTVHAREYLPIEKATDDDLMKLMWTGPRAERGRAIATLRERCVLKASPELERLVEEEPRAELRKHALLAIGRIGAPTAFPLLCETARRHRRSPDVAAYAVRALSGRPDAESVQFLVEYLSCDAACACLNAAAWSLVEIFSQHAELADPWLPALVERVRTLKDPYTRGCLIFALATTGERQLAGKIMRAVRPVRGETDDYVREDVCLAAGLLRDPETVPFLATCAAPDEPDAVVRRQAIIALRRIDTPAAQEALDTLDARPPAAEAYVRRALRGTLPPEPCARRVVLSQP